MLTRDRLRSLALVVLIASPVALPAASLVACKPGGPNPRTLHYVGPDLVASPPADHRAYAAYVQAQLALASEPPDLRRALAQIVDAIDYDPHDAHLWTVRGQIELQLGEPEQARRASERALSLRPDYPPARELAAKLLRPALPDASGNAGDARHAGISRPTP
ncbi:tetratricopeptide repeat protein [Nannocystis sp.]|uniref:tetratricopeptide repeat protein n=1 Tax=Nannocystis sp. TaxID=1962667 RepID=UPI002428567C|nr:tetratricopeptide repeat protein [Nannocystis sp.]MBK7826231.1 tetratricopeptide repeat protein [Nannocystis sp.]MBK9758256.1 tetratricopeptide repeat protein [Nannocystis sp.]